MNLLQFSCRKAHACILALFMLLLTGCVSAPELEGPSALSLSQPNWEFPPQKTMQEGTYEQFLAVNEKSLEECGNFEGCAVALFNLGFLHAYSKSPYLNFTKSLRYFERLNKEYPDSPWAFQAKAWSDILHRNIVLERNQRRMKESQQRLNNELKAKASAVTELHEEMSHTQSRIRQSQEGQSEVEQKERKLLQTISELQDQLKRSQEIDVEIEQKERELLQ